MNCSIHSRVLSDFTSNQYHQETIDAPRLRRVDSQGEHTDNVAVIAANRDELRVSSGAASDGHFLFGRNMSQRYGNLQAGQET
jgi:hypothetical protein